MCEGKCKGSMDSTSTATLSVQLAAAQEVSDIYLGEANALMGDLDRLCKLLAVGMRRDDEDQLNGEMVLMMVTAVIERYYEVFNYKQGKYVPMHVRMDKLQEAGIMTEGEASAVLARLDAMIEMFTTLAKVEASETQDDATEVTEAFIDKYGNSISNDTTAKGSTCPSPDSIFVDTEGNA